MKYKMLKWVSMLMVGSMCYLTACSQEIEDNQTSSDVIESIATDGDAVKAGTDAESDDTEESTEIDETTVAPSEDETEESSEAESEPEIDRNTVFTHYEDVDKLAVVDGVNTYVNIRMEPTTDSFCVGYANLYAGVIISKKVNDDWYEVDVDGNKGYIAAEFLLTGEEAKEAALEHATPRIKVETEVLNVRFGPSKITRRITQIAEGNLFEVQRVLSNGWVYIQLDSDIKGYVSGDFVSIEYYLDEPVYFSDYIGLSDVRKSIIEEALAHYGEAYVWGGTQLGVGVDCSGFMQQVYKKAAGISIRRTSYWQAEQGREVSFDEMQPGDLIFFITRGNAISHVGMYIGNGLMIHAASEDRGIVIDQYNYRTPEFARNLIGD
ncbi:MAG: NlpC/P60 family protein [Lachnospiraceae bacterium]